MRDGVSNAPWRVFFDVVVFFFSMKSEESTCSLQLLLFYSKWMLLQAMQLVLMKPKAI